MLTSRFETEDTDVRITTYNGAKITTYRNIKQAMLDRRREKELPPGDDGVWYWHCDDRDNGKGALQSARRAIDLAAPE